MTLRIKSPEVEKLAGEVAALTGEDETEAVRRALAERKERLASHTRPSKKRGERFVRFLQEEVWPSLAEEHRGKMPTREEEDEILGFGTNGA